MLRPNGRENMWCVSLHSLCFKLNDQQSTPERLHSLTDLHNHSMITQSLIHVHSSILIISLTSLPRLPPPTSSPNGNSSHLIYAKVQMTQKLSNLSKRRPYALYNASPIFSSNLCTILFLPHLEHNFSSNLLT